MRLLRSASEAVSCLLEQVVPGDFVRVRGMPAGGFGRVLPEDSPLQPGRPLTAGRLLVQVGDGQVEEFNEADLERVESAELPPDVLLQLAGPEEQTLESEFLHSLSPELAEEVGLGPFLGRKRGASRVPDPSRSADAKLSQRDPLTRQKKRIAMRRNWRRAKSRSAGGGKLGNEPSALRPFESMVEQAMADDVPMDKAPVSMGAETTYSGPVTPEEARIRTERVYDALSEVMRSLALAEGSTYFHSIQDDPDRGTLRLKLNGQTPKDIIERFAAGIEDLQVELLEKPEGDEDTRDLRGWWIFEATIPDFEALAEEEPEGGISGPMVPTSSGEFPGEIRIPVGDEG